jgi:hypothetical protein
VYSNFVVSPRRLPTMSAGNLYIAKDKDGLNPGGTGDRFAKAVTIVAGVAALVASLITVLYVFPTRL